jgi:hypothetical protein
MAADLAPDLRFLFAVVVGEIVVRGIADGTNNQFGECMRLAPASDGIKRLSVKSRVLS